MDFEVPIKYSRSIETNSIVDNTQGAYSMEFRCP